MSRGIQAVCGMLEAYLLEAVEVVKDGRVLALVQQLHREQLQQLNTVKQYWRCSERGAQLSSDT